MVSCHRISGLPVMFSLEFTGTVLTYTKSVERSIAFNSNIGLWENNQDIATKMMAKTVKHDLMYVFPCIYPWRIRTMYKHGDRLMSGYESSWAIMFIQQLTGG